MWDSDSLDSVLLVKVSSRGRRTRKASGHASLRCCSVRGEHWTWRLQTSQRWGRELWGPTRLFTSPRLTGNCKHAQQRPERGLGTHIHLHPEEQKEARGGEESLKSDCPTIHMHHQQAREPYCSKRLITTSELPAAGHSAMQTYLQSLKEIRLKNKNTPRQKCRASVITRWRQT